MGASLTRVPVSAKDAALEQHQYLTFMLGGETYAIGILHIREIIEHGGVTAMPMMPEFIRGVINLRGRAVPVIDLAARFGRGTTQVARRTCIVILEMEHLDGPRDIGVVVDAVNEVVEIPRAEIEPPPELGATIATAFMEGMGKVGGKFVILLDVDRILSLEELGVIARMPAAAAPDDRNPEGLQQ